MSIIWTADDFESGVISVTENETNGTTTCTTGSKCWGSYGVECDINGSSLGDCANIETKVGMGGDDYRVVMLFKLTDDTTLPSSSGDLSVFHMEVVGNVLTAIFLYKSGGKIYLQGTYDTDFKTAGSAVEISKDRWYILRMDYDTTDGSGNEEFRWYIDHDLKGTASNLSLYTAMNSAYVFCGFELHDSVSVDATCYIDDYVFGDNFIGIVDTFEDGSLSEYTTSNATGDTIGLESSNPMNGSYSLKAVVNGSGSDYAYAYRTYSRDSYRQTLCFRLRVKKLTSFTDNSGNTNLAEITHVSTGYKHAVKLYKSGSNWYIKANYYFTSWNEHGTAVQITENDDIVITLSLTIYSSSISFYFHVDGIYKAYSTGSRSGNSENPDRFDLGVINSSNDIDAEFQFDDVVQIDAELSPWMMNGPDMTSVPLGEAVNPKIPFVIQI